MDLVLQTSGENDRCEEKKMLAYGFSNNILPGTRELIKHFYIR